MKKYGLLSILLMLLQYAPAQTPDYSLSDNWAALPNRMDECDRQRVPKRKDIKLADSLQVDVFYVYPTLYDELPVESWAASINDAAYRKEVRELALKNQASVFGGLAHIYVPYYRQMHIEGYWNNKLSEVRAAFDTAYQDVLRAFRYYLENYNHNRPFVIASHSQGTNHTERLIREFILKDKALSERMLLAYLVGMPIENHIGSLSPCNKPEQTHCYLSWRTFGNGFVPPIHGDTILASHPILFSNLKSSNQLEDHLGILMPSGKLRFPASIEVQSKQGYLSVSKLKIPFSKRYRWDNYHIADYNLFWMNLRTNFAHRIQDYHERP